jgi:perosamine synthetase
MIPHNSPTIGGEELKAAQRALESGLIVQGPEIEAFENEF